MTIIIELNTVVVSCVCLCLCLSLICLSAHAILAVRAIKSITKDTIVLMRLICDSIEMTFFLKIVLFES